MCMPVRSSNDIKILSSGGGELSVQAALRSSRGELRGGTRRFGVGFGLLVLAEGHVPELGAVADEALDTASMSTHTGTGRGKGDVRLRPRQR